MKIIVKDSSSKKNINIRVPMFLITTAIRLGKSVIEYDIDNKVKVDDIGNELVGTLLKHTDKKELIRGLKYLNKHYKGLVLVDVESSDGDIVKIQI